MKKSLFLLILFLPLFSIGFAQQTNLTGKWKTVDDESGKIKSIVSIFKAKDGKYYGKIEKLFFKPGSLCEACEGEEKNKPIEGMIVIKNMEFSKDMLTNGTILNPENGKVYYCKISYDKKNQKLKVKGSLDKRGLLSRTQNWLRHNEN